MPVRIVVDANESRSGLADLLQAQWDEVEVRRLSVGDVAIGDRIVVERKTTADLAASLADGRMFGQARRLVVAALRPLVIHEGDGTDLTRRIDPGACRGAVLALCVGFRIPVLETADLEETARLLRHTAAQEARREARCRRRMQWPRRPAAGGPTVAPRRLPPEAFEVLLSLPQVGPARAGALARQLGCLGDLADLGVRDLLRVPGIGPDTAARIIDTLHGRAQSPTGPSGRREHPALRSRRPRAGSAPAR